MAPATVGGGGSHVNGRPATGIGGKAAAATVIGGPGPPSSGTANGQFSIIFGQFNIAIQYLSDFVTLFGDLLLLVTVMPIPNSTVTVTLLLKFTNLSLARSLLVTEIRDISQSKYEYSKIV